MIINWENEKKLNLILFAVVTEKNENLLNVNKLNKTKKMTKKCANS